MKLCSFSKIFLRPALGLSKTLNIISEFLEYFTFHDVIIPLPLLIVYDTISIIYVDLLDDLKYHVIK